MTAGNDIEVICVKGTYDRKKDPEVRSEGTYENIGYVYASGSPFRDDSFFRRRFFGIKGKINEVLLLRKLKRENKLDFAILSTGSFFSVLEYFVLSKIFRFKTILNYVEYYSALKKKRFYFGKRLNDKLFDRYACSLTDAVFPISEFLIAHMRKVSPGKKYLKVPVLTDFDKYLQAETLGDQKYFLFCGDASYKEVVLFIIQSFELLIHNNSHYLFLILSGKENNIAEIKNYVSDSVQRDRIKIFPRVTEKELYTYYRNSSALLIPLRPTFQDIARFPHKTGEYLASGNPVISTNYGEIKYYFTDKENMLIADQYDIKLFSEKMQFVIDNPCEAAKIGLRGRNLACQMFDYRRFSGVLDNFLDSGI